MHNERRKYLRGSCYRITCDAYTPLTTDRLGVYNEIIDKSTTQAPNMIIYLEHSDVSIDHIIQDLNAGLGKHRAQHVIFMDETGKLVDGDGSLP